MPEALDPLTAAVTVAAKQLTAFLDDALSPLGLTASNYYFILQIAQHETVSQEALFRLTHLTSSNVTRRLAQLTAAGLITKRHDPEDGRAFVTALTPAGRALVPQLTATLAAAQAEAFAGLDESQRQALIAMLHHVSHNLEA